MSTELEDGWRGILFKNPSSTQAFTCEGRYMLKHAGILTFLKKTQFKFQFHTPPPPKGMKTEN